MGDFPDGWIWVQDLVEGGQGYTYEVRRANPSESDNARYVLKRLKNPKRNDYFEREVRAYLHLNHPNILRLVDQGRTPKDRPFFVTEYCSGGSLERSVLSHWNPLKKLQIFGEICAAIQYAHSKGVFHLDIKPSNILLKADSPVVGDFGICYIENDQVAITSEGPRGSLYYCAPELRGRRISPDTSPDKADLYSLGKVLYWLFTSEVFDGHEDDYLTDHRRLLNLFSRREATQPSGPTALAFHLHWASAYSLADEIVEGTVRKNPAHRFGSSPELIRKLQEGIDSIANGGRVLDFGIPQRCLYCARGYYVRPYVATVSSALPNLAERKANDHNSEPAGQKLRALNDAAQNFFGAASNGLPVVFVCTYCGNVQYFRLDRTDDRHGGNWRP